MPLILGTNSIKDTGYDVANSVRFNRSDDSYMSRTFGTPTNRKKFTVSFWIKRSNITLSGGMALFGSDGGSSSYFSTIHFNPTDDLCVGAANGGSDQINLVTDRKFRDVAAWYHICVIFDSTQGTDTNRVKVYVNGIQETSFSSNTYPSQNDEFLFNQGTKVHSIGKFPYGSNVLSIDGYISEFVFIDGTTTSITDFGEFDEDSPTIWKAKDVSELTFGNNGCYLDFEDSGDLDDDESGNGNDFTATNVEAIDQCTDTCTNNFATLNPLAVMHSSGSNTFSEGNLKITNSADAFRTSISTLAVSKGKWYFESKWSGGEMKQYIGITKTQEVMEYLGQTANSYSFQGEQGRKYNNNSQSSFGSTASSGDIIMVAFDADNGAIWTGKNGTWFNSATQSEIEAGTTTNAMFSSITIDDFFAVGVTVEDSNIEMNFGSPPYSISSGNSDGNGYGNFEYAVPSGYYALNTKNLAEFG